jgi:hypothetical protein
MTLIFILSLKDLQLKKSIFIHDHFSFGESKATVLPP